MRSLRARTIALVLVAIAAVLLPLVVLSTYFIMDEVDELSDARLAQNARTISALVADSPAPRPGAAPLTVAAWHKAHDAAPLTIRGHHYETQIGFQVWTSGAALMMASDNVAGVALDAAPAGFADIAVGGRHWRVFTLLGESGRWIRVGERYDSRREIARALAVEAGLPILIALPLLALIVGVAVTRAMRPLRRLAEQLATRKSDATDPLGGSLPGELVPVVASLNGLLRRLHATLDHERAFTANAAHELRTPLAGALMHVENGTAALDAGDLDNTRRRLDDARIGLDRLTHLVNQLLDLARWDAGQTQPMAAVDLGACVDAELAGLGAAIADKDIAVHWRAPQPATHVRGWQPGLHTLVRNVLDNAVRYNADGGRLDITLVADDTAVILRIADSGPGIDAADRARLTRRFQRGARTLSQGSGIGLSLVARIAELHGATLRLDGRRDGDGLCVEIRFPAAAT